MSLTHEASSAHRGPEFELRAWPVGVSHRQTLEQVAGAVPSGSGLGVPASHPHTVFSETGDPSWTFWSLLHLLRIKEVSVLTLICQTEVSVT